MRRRASQGVCYQIRSILHQLIVVDKAMSDSRGFNQRMVVKTQGYRYTTLEFCVLLLSRVSRL